MLKRTLVLYVVLNLIYWSLIAASVSFGGWPVYAATYNLLTLQPVWGFEVVVQVVIAFAAFVAATEE